MLKFSVAKTCSIGIAVALAMLLTIIPQKAHACSCVPPGSPAEEQVRSTAIFAGKVIKTERLPADANSIAPMDITFDVTKVWKGPISQTLVVRSVICSYEFETGAEYLVYAISYPYQGEEYLGVSLCRRTRPLVSAAEDLTVLGEGVTPIDQNPELPSQPVSPLSPLHTGDSSVPSICVPPLPLVGMLSILSIRAMMRAMRARQSDTRWSKASNG